MSDLAQDLHMRVAGRAGRITLTRPDALNAMTYEMCEAIATILRLWREEERVAVVVFDAEGDKAFCAGGDIAELYETGKAGDFEFGRRFWRDEYRMNAMLAEYPKPVVSFLQGYTMGGGVGLGCHGSHRVVDEASRIAMPECGIGLVPDVGGTLMLARAPGRLGEYLGTTGTRMVPGDAIHAGFADHYIPRAGWADLIALLEASGDAGQVPRHSKTPPESALARQAGEIDRHFGHGDLAAIRASLQAAEGDFAGRALAALNRASPLSAAATVEMLHRLRGPDLDIRQALRMEYRFTFRAMEHADLLEGIRAQIIDKDRTPRWQHDAVPPAPAVAAMLAPLEERELTFGDEAEEDAP